jgi:hypothetical protein
VMTRLEEHSQAFGEWSDPPTPSTQRRHYEVLVTAPDLRAETDSLIAEVNARRSRVEGIRKHRILAHELTVASGELTPTLKIKRATVCDANTSLIEEMYAEHTDQLEFDVAIVFDWPHGHNPSAGPRGPRVHHCLQDDRAPVTRLSSSLAPATRGPETEKCFGSSGCVVVRRGQVGMTG